MRLILAYQEIDDDCTWHRIFSSMELAESRIKEEMRDKGYLFIRETDSDDKEGSGFPSAKLHRYEYSSSISCLWFFHIIEVE